MMRQRTGGYAHMWWMAVGGEIFAKTAKTPPLQSALMGRTLRPLPPINAAARRVATVFENFNCVIKISLPVKRLPYKLLPPSGSLAAVSLLEYGDLNHILPFSEGRSDAACRVVIPPFAVPIDARLVANGGRCRMRRRTLPAMPPVGAGSSQREDSPAHGPLPCRIAPPKTPHCASKVPSSHLVENN